jgi:hypothetical protein
MTTAALKVVPNEVDGWDVVRAEEGVSLTNFHERKDAERAARLIAHEEAHGGDEAEVIVDPAHPHGIDETQRGVKTYFIAVIGLLIAIAIIATVAALVGSETGFGS